MQSHEQRADKVALLESFDGYAAVRNGLKKVAADREDWSGIPMPVEGHRLIIEPSYPKAKELAEIGQKQEAEGEAFKDCKIRNHFYSSSRKCDVTIFQYPDGRVDWGLTPAVHHFSHDLQTLGASDAWGIEQESNALQLLGTLVRHRQMKQYLLTGMFLETSKRSGLVYCFRKLRPTVVIDTRKKKTRILCALCMHPIAYYAGSWAGAMTPTDDVVAHLMLMRGDEPMFWRRANQHAPWRPEAGL